MIDQRGTLRPVGDPAIQERLSAALRAVAALDPGDTYDPAIPAALVASGLHLLCLPAGSGGLGGGMAAAVDVLSALGALDGSTALGFAMHTHVVGALGESEGWSPGLRSWLEHLVTGEGALLNAASTEEGSGSPARGGLPATIARPVSDGYELTGQKTWTSWLPALRVALVTATIARDPAGAEADRPASPDVGLFVVDLLSAGVERRAQFEALGMRGSASGQLDLEAVTVPSDRLVVVRRPRGPDPRGSAPQAWFGAAIGAVYLGIGEGARRAVTHWAIERRPGDGSVAVADLPSVELRLGRLDAALRVARIVLEDVAQRWDASDRAARSDLLGDLALAKLTATEAAVLATDEALRIAGGAGFLAGRLERAQRDARAGLINPPLSDIALQGFARNLVEQARQER
jgi:alkylation response protein AidB-like acyl-CoA dehydrogenase